MLFSQNSSPLEKVFIFLLFSFARLLGRQIVLPASSPIIIVLLFLRNQRFGPSPDIGIGAQVVIKHLIGVGRICVQHVCEYDCVRLFSKSVCLGLTWPNRPPLLKWLRWDAFWFSLFLCAGNFADVLACYVISHEKAVQGFWVEKALVSERERKRGSATVRGWETYVIQSHCFKAAPARPN